MKHNYVRALLCGMFLVGVASAARAQNFASQAGVKAAAAKAKDSLASDAQLAFIATFGNLSQPPLTLTFDLDRGTAPVWLYVFSSPSTGKSATIAVAQLPIFGFQAQGFGQAIPLPQQLDLALDTSGTYSNSTTMMAQLKTDSTYARYHAELPDAKPGLISFGQLLQAGSLSLPNGFPLDEPTWTMSFTGGGDSSMTCLVAAKSGAHFCRRLALPASVLSGATPAAPATMEVSPNPVTGRTHLAITLPDGARIGPDARLVLFDERGAAVLDLSSSFRAGGYHFVEFDASMLPAGVYYGHATGNGWQGTVGVIVEK